MEIMILSKIIKGLIIGPVVRTISQTDAYIQLNDKRKYAFHAKTYRRGVVPSYLKILSL